MDDRGGVAVGGSKPLDDSRKRRSRPVTLHIRPLHIRVSCQRPRTPEPMPVTANSTSDGDTIWSPLDRSVSRQYEFACETEYCA